VHEPQSIKKQKEEAKCTAITSREGRFYNNPRTSMAFRTALRSPPDRKAHHTFNIKQIKKPVNVGTQNPTNMIETKETKLISLDALTQHYYAL
jgi:hypothetical protein